MRFWLLATFALSLTEPTVEHWLHQAFYPVLLLTLLLASLGVPIPEDIPLIAAGVVLRTHPDAGSWSGTFFIALVGVTFGDLVLYTIGKWWGPEVVQHRSVRWLIQPSRFAWMSARFRKYGAWMCFFGRFVVGVRAVMCLTAGATRFPYWRFFLADFLGAVLMVPLMVLLGYWFAGVIPQLQAYLIGAQGLLFAILAIAVLLLVVYEWKRIQKRRARIAGRKADPLRVTADAPAVARRSNRPPQQRAEPAVPVESER